MYLPVGRCIYCGTSEGPLSREHIIPYALGGNRVLPQASCQPHARKTSHLELEVARLAYGIHRAESGSRSRHKGKLRSLLDRVVQIEGKDFAGNVVQVSVPIGEVPPTPLVVRLPAPGIVTGRGIDADGSCSLEMPPEPDPRLRRLREKLGLKELTSPVATVPLTNFLRFLAKIGHAFTVAEIGLNGFSPVLRELILDGPVGCYYYVGEHAPPKAQSPLQDLNLRSEKVDGDSWLVVDINLHFFPRMPTYQVFVGTVPSEA